MIKNCQNCGKQFHVKPSRIKRGGGKFCSRKCYHSLPFPKKICLYCQQPAKKRGMCNRHYLRWYRYGDPHFRQRRAGGEGTISTQGYRVITIDGKLILEHRHVMEQHLGRKLSSQELIHHIDGNKLNNELSNLQLITRCSHPHLHPDNLENWQKLGSPARWKRGTT
jgi:hypothetical protein